MSSTFAVMLDANVLFPIALCDTLIRAAREELYRPHWTATILDEMERNIVAQRRTTVEKARHRRQQMETALPFAIVSDYESLIPAMGNDAKDRHVLVAAVHAGAQVIVTENMRHFPYEACAIHNVEARTADTFLSDLFDMAPEIMLQIIHEQAADFQNPPQSPEQVLAALRRITPEFARAALARLYRPAP